MDEKKRKSEFAPLGDVVNQLMKAYQLDGKWKEQEVLAKWEEMMGKAVALRTKKLYIRDRILYIQLDSSVMRDELADGKRVIIQRVNETANSNLIDDIWFF